jgi:hypothetical protein
MLKLERRNAYFCKECRKVTITVDIDNGVTPMFIKCHYCYGAMANSFMYNLPGCLRYDFSNGKIAELPADLEWYKPSSEEYEKLSPHEKEHIDKGGLIYRLRTDKPAIMIN